MYGPFHMGRFGVPVIILALAYSIVGTFFSMWPPVKGPTVMTMNWSSVVTVGYMAISLVFWFLHGRRVYKGPIVEVVLRDTRE